MSDNNMIRTTNLGPIRQFSFSVDPNGGVTVLKGRNGVGKSHILQGVKTLLNGKGELPITDGEEAAEVSGLGLTVRFSKRLRKTGELSVESLDSEVDPSDLVDPGIQQPDRADAARIKALVKMTGAKATPEMFAKLAPGVEITVEPSDDPLVLADRSKRRYEQLSREQESIAAACQNRAAGIETTPVAYDGSLNAQELSQETIAQTRRLVETETRHKAYRESVERCEKARAMAASLSGTSQTGVDELCKEHGRALVELRKSDCRVADLQRELEAAIATAADCEKRSFDLERRLNEAYASKNKLDDTLAEIDRLTAVPVVHDGEIEIAVQKLNKAKEAERLAGIVRDNTEKLVRKKQLQDEAAEALDKAQELRDAAAACEDVLTELANKANTGLFVRGGRLRLKTDRSEQELFADLSDGERIKVAIRACVSVSNATTQMTISQRIWDQLDDDTRHEIAQYARSKRVGIVTAQAEATDLHAVQM